MRAKYIGPYQRPAPAKRPLGLNSRKTIQKPAVPMHEIQAQEQRLLEDIKASGNVLGLTAKVRKPGRPSVYEEPMTPAERQARRRALKAREGAIELALRIKDGHGKSRIEADSGGYGSGQIEVLAGSDYHHEGTGGRGRHVCPGGASPEGGESSLGIHVHGLRVGDEESNRTRFAEAELKKMVWQYFVSPDVNKTPSVPRLLFRYIADANVSIRRPERLPSLTLTCKMCGDVMNSTQDAADHLRVDHPKTISEWFRHLKPSREFRDMGVFVTVVNPRKRKGILNHRVIDD
jgi:hypothetical protein